MEEMKQLHDVKVIAFDADDTLWVNEPYFQETEQKFCGLLEDYMPAHSLAKELFKTEIGNLPLYGYGVKGFMLCMIETALNVTGDTLDPKIIRESIRLGQELLNRPIELLEGIEDVLKQLSGKYRLVVATKGDLLDQERKLIKSGIAHYFHHIEIMSEKHVKDYQKLLKHLDCRPEEFMMIGNSIKSDILPVLELGGYAVHIPYHTTWAHEQIEAKVEHPNFSQLEHINELLLKAKLDDR